MLVRFYNNPQGRSRANVRETVPSDFFPWTGSHSEDTLNENSSRNGFFDKLSASQNESLTARPSILSTLRTRAGPKILSSLFVSVLEQRQEHGTITTSSTFKPPPRVTLTDAKREAWLRDLANPFIPLRRLSRTIPHGVRGKVLLEHCLSKDIPTPRAMWLVKCVGANEIRAFKRKGTSGAFTVGGENKWVQEWTVNVEQFIQGLVANCGSEQWKDKFSYGLRLAWHIYSEDLLDRELYLRWLVQSLEQSDLDALPLWTLIFRMHRLDLAKSRLHSSRVTAALLSHLHETCQTTKASYDSLQQDLIKLLGALLASFPTCFLLPSQWKSYETLIRSKIVGESRSLLTPFEDVRDRNLFLENPAAQQDQTPLELRGRSLVKILDNALKERNSMKTANSCLELTADHSELVRACMEWATSYHRQGTFRVHTAAAVMRSLAAQGVQLQDHIYDFLTSDSVSEGFEDTAIFKLLIELAVTRHFSVARYCQWLLARGSFRNVNDSPGLEIRFLFQLPLSGLADHVQNLRSTLLYSLGYSTKDEDIFLEQAKVEIINRLKIVSSVPEPPESDDDCEETRMEYEGIDFSTCSLTIKHELAKWICEALSSSRQERKVPKWSKLFAANARPSSSLEQTIFMRHLLEQLGDYASFADFLRSCCESTNIAVLAAVTDTINYHFDNFAALDVVDQLFVTLYNQAQILPLLKDADRAFADSLLDLALRLPSKKPEMYRLQKDRRSFEMKQSAAAPSPISDTMIDAVHQDTSTFREEMEQLLTNGSSIDQVTFARAFAAITQRFEQSWQSEDIFHDRVPELLARLRTFNPPTFHTLFTAWLDTLFQQEKRPPLAALIPPMICHKLITLTSIIDRLSKASIRTLDKGKVKIFLDLIGLLIATREEAMPHVQYRCYRFLDQQQLSLQRSLPQILRLLSNCFRVACDDAHPLHREAHDLMYQTPCRVFVQKILVQVAINNISPLELEPEMLADIGEVLNHWKPKSSLVVDPSSQIAKILDVVSALNTTIFQFEILNLQETTFESEVDLPELLAKAIIDRISEGSLLRLEGWSNLVSALPKTFAATVRQHAEQMLMAEVDKALKLDTMPSAPILENTLKLVGLEAASIDANKDTSTIAWMEKTLTCLLPSKTFSVLGNDIAQPRRGLAQCTETMLRTLVVYQSAFQHAHFKQADLSTICVMLSRLYMCLVAGSQTQSATRALDVLCLLSDSLTEASRSRCLLGLQDYRNQEGMTSDPLMAYIFGPNPNDQFQGDSKWIYLVRDQRQSAAGGNAATSTQSAKQNLDSKSTPLLGDSGNDKDPNLSFSMTEQPSERFQLRKWEMVQDTAPLVTENDTSLSLTLFGARKSVL